MIASISALILTGTFFTPGQAITCGDTYTVRVGDYLSKIAWTCGVSMDDILAANPEIKTPNWIFPGQVIVLDEGAGAIPLQKGTYLVESGDTLSEIAVSFNTSINELMRLNPEIISPWYIYTDKVIQLPQESSQPLIILSPLSIQAGYRLWVEVKNFPPNVEIDYWLGKKGGALTAVRDGKTDSSGYQAVYLTIPASAISGEDWVVTVRTTELPELVEVTSANIRIK